jgi:hypothetical protein
MAIAFRCTGCRHPFSVHDHLAGKRIKCAQCGTSLVVPVGSAQSAPVAEVPDGPPPRRRSSIVAAAPAPPRQPAPPVEPALEHDGAAFSEVAAAVGTPSIHVRRRRGMPLVGWVVIFIGVTACVVLAVMVFQNDTWRAGVSRVANDTIARDADSHAVEQLDDHKVGNESVATLQTSEGVDHSVANSTTVVTPPAQSRANARSRGDAALQAAIVQMENGNDNNDPAYENKGDGNANNDVQANQRIVVRQVTRFRDENDKESFVHDRTEGRFLKFDDGMARVALEIRIGEETTGRVPAQDLDFGRPVELDDVDAIAALKKAGAKLTADRLGYTERLECPFKMTDELFELAARLPRLAAINANFSGVTDAGLAHLKGHKRLKELLLSQTAITDAGLAHLAAIPTLEKLDLEETNITDAGLLHLVAHDKLRQGALR